MGFIDWKCYLKWSLHVSIPELTYLCLLSIISLKIRDVKPTLVQGWAIVLDGGSTLVQWWMKVFWILGYYLMSVVYVITV